MLSIAAHPLPFEAPAWPTRSRPPGEFTRAEGIVVVLGATALCLLLGAGLALVLGRAASLAVEAALWLIFAFTFQLASQTFAELLRGRAWRAAGLYALHLLAFAPWASALLFASPAERFYWLAPAALLGALAAFLLIARPRARMVYRAVEQAALIAGLTSLQAMFVTFAA